MTRQEQLENKCFETTNSTDIVVIGAGPSGLAFCRSMEDSGLDISLIDPNSAQQLASPPVDGREVSIIRETEQLLTDLGAWQRIDDAAKYPLQAAKVFNGKSEYSLNFDAPHNERNLLGFFVPNYRIRKALFSCVNEQDNIAAYFGSRVIAINSDKNYSTVQLDTGELIRAKLVISADSRYSQLRRTMGIATSLNDFGRSVIIFRMHHSISNQLTAMECFHYGRTMAVLPLGEYESSIVITIDSSQAEALEQLDSKETERDVMQQLTYALGDMQLASEKYRYPLVGVHAKKFYARRYALIGDTAVGMHPVTAQGFNLGMQSQNILSSLIKEASRSGEDIGSQQLLERYQRLHKRITVPLYYGTNAIVHLFTTDNPLAKPFRHLVLRAGNHFPGFKYLVNKRLSG